MFFNWRGESLRAGQASFLSKRVRNYPPRGSRGKIGLDLRRTLICG
ncbi:unnamed protein product, partial [Arabidopsis halleri]